MCFDHAFQGLLRILLHDRGGAFLAGDGWITVVIDLIDLVGSVDLQRGRCLSVGPHADELEALLLAAWEVCVAREQIGHIYFFTIGADQDIRDDQAGVA